MMDKIIKKKFEDVEDTLDKVMMEGRDLDQRLEKVEEKLK